MRMQGLTRVLAARLDDLAQSGGCKGKEGVISSVIAGHDGHGPRYAIEGDGGRAFELMNSTSYLGMALRAEVIEAEEQAAALCGPGRGAVRFVSGPGWTQVAWGRRLASCPGRSDAILFSSAYAGMMGLIQPLVTAKTAVISDELNHNCIINAIALARPAEKHIYKHLDIGELERALSAAARTCTRAVVVTDGIFSMRGDHAPLDRIMELAQAHDGAFEENAIVIVDDSHGVGAFGPTGRGTEEYTNAAPADLLVATLGKAFGVNGAYVAGDETIIRYLPETSPFYIYSNPITPAAALPQLIRGRTDAARLWPRGQNGEVGRRGQRRRKGHIGCESRGCAFAHPTGLRGRRQRIVGVFIQKRVNLGRVGRFHLEQPAIA